MRWASYNWAKLDAFIDERHKWADFYINSLAGIPWLTMPEQPVHGRHAWQAFVTRVDPGIDRNAVMAQLHETGIATRPGTHAIHTLGYYRDRFGWADSDYPESRDCQAQTMAIPLHNKMASEDFERVVAALYAARV